MRRSDNLIADGLYEKALSCLDEVLEENPDDEKALSQKGLVYCLMGESEKGIEFLEKALDIEPFSKTVLITFADACLRCAMADRSLEILDTAIAYYPDDDGLVMLKEVIIGAMRRVTVKSYLN